MDAAKQNESQNTGRWDSSGEFSAFQLLKPTIVVGDKSGRILARQRHSEYSLNLPGLPNPSWKWISYKHNWECNFGTCRSHLLWSAIILDDRDGSEITWEHVELAARDAPDEFNESNIGNQPFYRYVNGPINLLLTWDKEGRDLDFTTGAKCWLQGHWWFWLFHSHSS